MSLRDDILGYTALPRESVNVPEWGGRTVWVRTMPSTEKTVFEIEAYRNNGATEADRLGNVKAKLLVRTLTDESGALLFSPDDEIAVGQLHPIAIDRCFKVAQRLNLEVGDVEELAKNSAAPQG